MDVAVALRLLGTDQGKRLLPVFLLVVVCINFTVYPLNGGSGSRKREAAKRGRLEGFGPAAWS